MSPIRIVVTFLAVVSIGTLLMNPSVFAQEAAASPEKTQGKQDAAGVKDSQPKTPFDPSKAQDAGLGMPTPLDKFLAIELLQADKPIAWKPLFNAISSDVDPDDYTDTAVSIPLVLGLRIADGVMAIQARDAEMLNQCASDIERLALKLGVKQEEMARAQRVRSLANDGDWLRVFMELGFLQQDIHKTMARSENTGRSALLVAAGWMQAARYTSSVIIERYTNETSNVMREPKLAEAILLELEKQPDSVKKHPAVSKLFNGSQIIGKAIDVPLESPIPIEQIREIKALADDFSATVLQTAK